MTFTDDELQNQGVTTEADEDTAPGENAAPETDGQKPDDTSTESPRENEEETHDDSEARTDKGTKVAKEPQSQYYQNLKNENADMRRLLQDPKSLKAYMREVEGTEAPQAGQEDDLEKVVESSTMPNGQVDVHKLLKLWDERWMKRMNDGMQKFSTDVEKRQTTMKTYDRELSEIRRDHPELDPFNKDRFDPELDEMIGDRYIAAGGLGKASLKEVVDKTYHWLERQRGTAEKRAEQEVVRKKAGAISKPSVSGEDADPEAGLSPEEVVARRVRSNLLGNASKS